MFCQTFSAVRRSNVVGILLRPSHWGLGRDSVLDVLERDRDNLCYVLCQSCVIVREMEILAMNTSVGVIVRKMEILV